MIVEGEEGFDMRFASDGLKGRGNYFAINASYSCGSNYVHTERDGTKGVFLASVLTGESASDVDQNRKMPPLKPGS